MPEHLMIYVAVPVLCFAAGLWIGLSFNIMKRLGSFVEAMKDSAEYQEKSAQKTRVVLGNAAGIIRDAADAMDDERAEMAQEPKRDRKGRFAAKR